MWVIFGHEFVVRSNVTTAKENILKAQKHGMGSEYMFKALLKAYTGESLHQAFAKKLITGKYDEI